MSPFQLLLHLLRLSRAFDLRPREAHPAGLSDPRLPASRLAGAISMRALTRLQARLNARDLSGLVWDKGFFQNVCQGMGLPVPRLIATFDRRFGLAADGTPLRDAGAWEQLLGRVEGDIVVKPARGMHGQGVRVLERTPGGFRDVATGQAESAQSLTASFFADPDGRLVVQQRLSNHPEIVRLTDNTSLQTVRFRTLVTQEGECLLGGTLIRFVGGDNVIDNIVHGRSGNFAAGVRLEDGVLRTAVVHSASGIGVEPVTRHPKTGLPLEGFRLPCWEEACALVRRAARLFFPLRTIGWDVALTAKGPVLVEGNSRWDPPNYLCAAPDDAHAREMAVLLARLREEAARLGAPSSGA